jgi:O-acetylserine/cysteine efflux transporter
MAMAIYVAVIYGTAFVAIRAGVEAIPPLALTGLRYFFSFFPICFLVAMPKTKRGLMFTYGVAQGVIMFGIIFTAIALGMPAGLASLVVQIQVFFTVGFAMIIYGERPDRWQIAAFGIAIIGMSVIGADYRGSAVFWPFVLTVVSALAWAGANIVSKAAKPKAALPFIVWSSFSAWPTLFVLSLVFEDKSWLYTAPDWSTLAAILYLAYPTTVIGFAAWVWLLNNYPATTVTPFALLIPVFGFASTNIIYGETVSAQVAIGSLIIFASLALNVISRFWIKRRNKRISIQ